MRLKLMIKKLLFTLLLLIVLCGCATPMPTVIRNDVPVTVTPQPIPSIPTLKLDYGHRVNVDGNVISRFVDIDAGVVCYMYSRLEYSWSMNRGYNTVSGGISCLPLSVTALEY